MIIPIKQHLKLDCITSNGNVHVLMPLELVKVVTDPKAYEIDHIIPRSVSQDNSLNNKVLVS